MVGVVAYDGGYRPNGESTRTHHTLARTRSSAQKPAIGVKLPASSSAGVLPGRFRMGSPPDEPQRLPDEEQVDVTLTKGFWMGKYEVTQGQWKRVVGKLPGELTADGGKGKASPSTTSTTPRRKRSVAS